MKKIRHSLIEELSYDWRWAENQFLKTGSDEAKHNVLLKQSAYNLSSAEEQLLQGICNSMGI